MHNILKLSIILILSFIINQMSYSENSKKIIKIGYFIAPPFTFESSDQKAIGAVIDFYRNHIMPNVPYQFDFEGYPMVRLLKDLKEGNIDLVAMTSSDKGNFGIVPGKNAFYKSKNFLITKKAFKYNKINSVDQLKNIVIGLNKDGSKTPFIEKNMNKLQIEETTNIDSVSLSIKKLLAGRVDALYGYLYISFIYIAKKEHAYDKIKLVEIPGNPVYIYTGYSPKLNPKIREKIENQIYIQIHDKKFDLNNLIKNVE
jgi:polar amino acid transport system substrate-binding protein